MLLPAILNFDHFLLKISTAMLKLYNSELLTHLPIEHTTLVVLLHNVCHTYTNLERKISKVISYFSLLKDSLTLSISLDHCLIHLLDLSSVAT